MNAGLNSRITNREGEFVVFTKSGGLIFRRTPRTSVMPLRVEGFLAGPGFQVQYTTGDPRVLAEWHEMLCQRLESGSFSALCADVASGCFSYPTGKEHLRQYAKRFV